METIKNFLYDAADWIMILSIAMGLINAMIPIVNTVKNLPKEKPAAHKQTRRSLFSNFATVFALLLIILCLVVKERSVRVPQLAGMYQIETSFLILQEMGLEAGLETGLARDRASDYMTSSQSVPAGVLVEKGSRIILGYEINQDDEAPSTEISTSDPEPSSSFSVPDSTVLEPISQPSQPNNPASNVSSTNNDGLIEVPDVETYEQIAATDVLTAAGLTYQVWWTEEDNITSDLYYVKKQEIPAGSFVPPGTLVQLQIAPMQ